MEVPQKKINKNRTTYNSTSGHIYEESSNSKRYMHPDVHSSTIYNSNLSSPSTDKWTKKKQFVYNGRLLSHKKERNNAICNNLDGPREDPVK